MQFSTLPVPPARYIMVTRVNCMFPSAVIETYHYLWKCQIFQFILVSLSSYSCLSQCYYIGGAETSATGLLNEVARPLSYHMPALKICEKLSGKDEQICELKYGKYPLLHYIVCPTVISRFIGSESCTTYPTSMKSLERMRTCLIGIALTLKNVKNEIEFFSSEFFQNFKCLTCIQGALSPVSLAIDKILGHRGINS